jgi:hypothetical protein
MITTGYIRELENESKWKEALAEWKSIRSLPDSKEWIDLQISAVQLIVDSISRGDAHRERTWNYIESLCKVLQESNVDDVSDLRRVEKILDKNYFEYSEVDLLHIQNTYYEYLDNGRIDWGA